MVRMTVDHRSRLLDEVAILQQIYLKNAVPLMGIWLRPDQQQIDVCARDTTLEVVSQVTAAVGNEEEDDPAEISPFAMRSERLGQILRELSADQPLVLAYDENAHIVELTSGAFQASFATADWMKRPDPVWTHTLTVDAARLASLLTSVLPAIPAKNEGTMLAGALLDVRETDMRAVATDGRRLSIASLGFDEPVTPSALLLVPQRAVKAIVAVLEGQVGHARFDYTEKQEELRVTVGQRQLRTTLMAGKFPPYERILPTTEADWQVSVNRAAMMDAMRCVAASTDGDEEIWLDLVPQQGLTLTTGETSMTVPALTSASGRVGLHSEYLRQALAQCPTAEIALSGDQAFLKPVLIEPIGHLKVSVRHFIAPLKR